MTSLFWTVPELWKGETCFIIGGGPSLIGADYGPIKHRKVIGTNQAFTLGHWIDFTFFGDYRWWGWNMEREGTRRMLEQYRGIFVTAQNKALYHNPLVRMLKRRGHQGIRTDDRSAVCWNMNSGAAAINLAALLGANKIVLLGFDMKRMEGAPGLGHNWHDAYAARQVPKNDIYDDRLLKPFPAIAADLEGLGIECINASPNSAIEVFEKVGLEEGMRIQ